MKRTLLVPALVAIVLAACSPFARPELSRARERWQAAHVNHYRYKLNVGCFCGFTEKMPLTIEVKEGQLVSMSYQDGSPVSAQDAPMFAQYETIDALFDFTEESMARADEMKAEYDATYGFPSEVQIDFIKNAADDELTLSVSDFEPLP